MTRHRGKAFSRRTGLLAVIVASVSLCVTGRWVVLVARSPVQQAIAGTNQATGEAVTGDDPRDARTLSAELMALDADLSVTICKINALRAARSA